LSELVFILGAGASAHTGAPVMSTFLDEAARIERMGRCNDVSAQFRLVFKAMSRLAAVHSKSDLDQTNIETLMGVSEMASLLQVCPGLEATEIEHLGRAIRTLIHVTLRETVNFGERRDRLPFSLGYGRLVNLLRSNQHWIQRTSFITFNYDVALDYTLINGGFKPAYHLHESGVEGVPLLKLHGSINWRECDDCKGCIGYLPCTAPNFGDSHNHWPAQFIRGTCALCQQSLNPELDPVLVPPTWRKGEYHHALKHVWTAAARHLAEARHIVVIGYSLPESDAFFRYLLALGTYGDTLLENFWVIDTNKQVLKRFADLLGKGARRRYEPIKGAFGYESRDVYPTLYDRLASMFAST
jgi:hypothetical protein